VIGPAADVPPTLLPSRLASGRGARFTPLVALATLLVALATLPTTAQGQESRTLDGVPAESVLRPMEIADLFRQNSPGQVQLSPDGSTILYTLTPGSFPDPGSRHSQIRMARVDGSMDRAMTHGRDAANRDPRWHPSGALFGFTSTREGNGRQLYLMPVDGGEARRVTDLAGGVQGWGWSDDGRYLAVLGGRGADRQIWLTDGEARGGMERLTHHPTPVSSFQWRESGHELLFLADDAWDEADHRRREAGFRARPIQRGLVFSDFIELFPTHLWHVEVGSEPRRITEGDLIVQSFHDSPRGDRVALVVGPRDPHADNRPNEIHLVDPANGAMERLTENEVGESLVGFSPSGSHLAISAPRDFQGSGVSDIFVRPVEGGEWSAVTGAFDNTLLGGVWSEDGRAIYFVGADGVNRQLFRVGIDGGEVERLSDWRGVAAIRSDSPGPVAILGFTTPEAPEDLYAVPWNRVGDREAWTRLTELNPWVDEVQLARTETVRWTSTDGTEVEGLIVYPLDHDPDRRYPLVTDIHGGPAAAYVNEFLPTSSNPHRAYGHYWAAMDYALFLPNYRGSSHYGHDFQVEIVGDYWTRATEDIHTGIDHLVEAGLAHPDSLLMMGWSAGGHWSNWMLVTTDRFRAIATGAGVTNWISLYGQTDNQASREWYLGRDAGLNAPNQPWHDFDHWWAESPLKYIENASTPTLIHFPQADQRIPMPQGQELHLALKKLGVPTEFLVYPDELHALQDPRNQLVKLMGEVGWFETWLRDRGPWLDWDEVLSVADGIEAALAEP